VNRTEIGRREFGRATAGKGPVATGRVREASPVLAAGVEEFIFADVFSRSGLPARERELLTVAVLAAIGGADNQLGVHVPAALECGADAEEIIQLCEQIAPYAGFPRALNALRAVRAVLEERGLPLPLAVSAVQLTSHQTLVAETGAGETGYLFLHAPELDRRMWRDVMRALPDGRRAIAPDLRGAGAAVGAPAADDIGGLVADAIGVMDAAGLARAVVVAQGASASLGLAMAVSHPDRVAHIVAVAPGSGDAAAPPVPAQLAGLMRSVALAEDGWASRYARDRYRRVDLDGWRGLVDVLGSVDPSAASPAPVTVVSGDAGDAVAGVWSSYPATVVPDAGALVGLEAPGPLAAVLAGIR
jgi:3-oxoadipate enol-lactonase